MSIDALTDARTRATSPPRTAVPLWVAVPELAARGLKAAAREGYVISAIGSPIAFFVCFYVPLHARFDRAGVDYAQYLVPLIIMQAAIFVAIVSCEIAGTQAQSGVRDRLASLPIPLTAPLCSRMISALVRMAASIAAACLIAWAFGFGFRGSWWDTAGFVTIAIAFALALSLVTDALASVVDHPDSVAQMLMLPQLLLIMVSTGLVPAQQFPEWIQPVVRNSPVSVFADAMRELSVGADPDAAGVIGWAVGLLAVGVACSVLVARRQVTR